MSQGAVERTGREGNGAAGCEAVSAGAEWFPPLSGVVSRSRPLIVPNRHLSRGRAEPQGLAHMRVCTTFTYLWLVRMTGMRPTGHLSGG
jgi:hypothetical protein